MKTLKKVSVGLLLLSAVAITSCKKDSSYCSTCMVKNSSGTVIKNYGEKCGTGTDVDNYEASCKTDASQISGAFTCNRK